MPLFQQQTRADLRRVYIDAWRKYRDGDALEPLEAQVAQLIAEHPEYHALLEAEAASVQAEFLPESGAQNPFLHLALHLAIREQVSTDRPAGIHRLHTELASQLRSAHEAEHRMLEVLGEVLWESQRRGTAPDDAAYLVRLQRLAQAPGRK